MSWQIQDGAKTCLSKEGRKKTQGKNNSVYSIFTSSEYSGFLSGAHGITE